MAEVLLGMSGGVDSTVSAYLLRRAGHKVTGITFIMHGDDTSAADAVEGARLAAREAGIDFTSADLRSRFRDAVESPFADAYFSGSTPNPCVLCNARIKFPELLRYADELGFSHIATGHYASVTEKNGYFHISEPADKAKDQTYFLYSLGQDVLSRLILPLSDLTKDDVRRIASEQGFSCAVKRDSQDVCFIPDGDVGAYLNVSRPGLSVPGDFTDASGKILGRHKGIANYTVGQRKGLGIASDAPLYVQRIDMKNNSVILCRDNELFRSRIRVGGCVYAAEVPSEPFRADVRIRYTKRVAPATVTPLSDGGAIVVFDSPQRAPAPGQSAVFYLTEGGVSYVFGGGTIVYDPSLDFCFSDLT